VRPVFKQDSHTNWKESGMESYINYSTTKGKDSFQVENLEDYFLILQIY
jgi:hypothetical protein